MKTFPVIMCGGSGTRLWPASRPSRPKQFIPLVGSQTLFEQTVDRVCDIEGVTEIIVIAGEQHAKWVCEQIGRSDIPTRVLLEPIGRDTGPAIAAATAYVEKIDPQGVMVVVSSDQYIPNNEVFCSDIQVAVKSAREGSIVTLGIAPVEPSSAYGYIQPKSFTEAVATVHAFYEKPDRETAAKYITQGYFWNSGNFIARADTLVEAFEATAADLLKAARRGLQTGRASGGSIVLGAPFKSAPKLSFDYAVMEKFEDLKIICSAVAWSDLGAWDAVHHNMNQDTQGNASVGDAILVDSRNSYVRVADGQTVVASCVEGLNIIVDDDVVFVSRLDRSQDVKKVVEVLKETGRSEVDMPDPFPDLQVLARQWRQWLNTAALPLWWSNGYNHETELFRESLTLADAEPTNVSVRARVQGRQAYVYARAATSGWCGPWRKAMRSGLNAAASHYAAEDGLMHTLAGQDGKVVNDDVYLYDQTFILLALCHARNEIGDAEEQALAGLTAIEQRFGRDDGGSSFCETGDHPFQSNALMHLFEAAMAWVEAGGNGAWRVLADEIADLAVNSLIDTEGGLIRKYYTSEWKQAEGDEGYLLEPGHQFEWAYLLKRWATLTGNDAFAEIAKDLFKTGLAGVDWKRGVAVLQMDDNFVPVSDIARLWTQTEWLKAAVILAADSKPEQEDFYQKQVKNAAKAMAPFLATAINGLWYDKMMGNGSFIEKDVPASTFYHIISAVEALEHHVNSIKS